MSNELRGSIAHRLWNTEEKSYEKQAQSIMDMLGLTVEWQTVSRQIFNDGTARENPTQYRYVSKWVEE